MVQTIIRDKPELSAEDAEHAPAIMADGLETFKANTAELSDEYARLLHLPKARVTKERKQRFTELALMLGKSENGVLRDVRIIAEARRLEAKLTEARKWEAEARRIADEIAKHEQHGPQTEALDEQRRNAEMKAATGNARVNLMFLRNKHWQLLGRPEPRDDAKLGVERPLQSGAARVR